MPGFKYRWYDEAFADLPVVLVPAAGPGERHARHLYTQLLDLEHLDVDSGSPTVRCSVLAGLSFGDVRRVVRAVRLVLRRHTR